MKRFWDTATIEATVSGYAILLDGRKLHLPSGAVLLVDAEPLARAISDEWQRAGRALGDDMSFADTPLTRLAGTLQERIAPDRAPTIHALGCYAESDLLCYRAEVPEELVRRQMHGWQPWLCWTAQRYDAPLRVGIGIVAVKQPVSSVTALRRAVAELDAPALTALGVVVPALGSLVLGLALAEGALDAATAYSLGCLDELFQAEVWGEDAEAAARRRGIAEDIAIAERFLRLAQGRTVQ